MHGPPSAGAAIGKTNNSDVDTGEKLFKLRGHSLALFARTTA